MPSTKTIQRSKLPRIGLIIIDECSTLNPTHIVTIDDRLSKLMGIDMDFGGIGDFMMQNLPVKQTSTVPKSDQGLNIIDECSTTSPADIVTIDDRLRKLTGIDMDFGGIGDFMQNLKCTRPNAHS
jgi:predicted phosphatase